MVDAELLEILVCPKCKGKLETVELPEEVRARLVEKYREHFRDEEPEVHEGLVCRESELVYPIVSDIPILLVEDALPSSALSS
ncbi:MAG TPA: Trm112 family protein [Thermoanaerobaculia bacterium]|nr:Trm112 family protein [Thermoanaerobaculia bacterium]